MNQTTIDEVIYCGTVWMDALVQCENAGIMKGDQLEKAIKYVDLCYERYDKALTAYEAQQAFEDKLEAQIAEELAQLMDDPR